MRIGTLFFAAIACAVLVACGTTGTSRIALNCPGGTCQSIDVTVNQTASGGCELASLPDLNVSTEPNGQKRISWLLPAGNYEWSPEPWKYAIFIQEGSPPAGKFGPATITEAGKKLEIHFNHVQGPVESRFKYALTVRRSSGAKEFCKTLDPWIIS